MKASALFTDLGYHFALATMFLALPATVTGADVNFYLVLKNQKFNQNDAGIPTQQDVGNPFRFNAQVSPTTVNSVLGGTVTTPSGVVQALTYDPASDVFDFQQKFTTQSALDAAFGSGTYTLNVNTKSDGHRTLALTLPTSNYPGAPHISNYGAAQAIDSATGFSLNWDSWPDGSSSDYIDVLVGDAATGQILFRSPQPFAPGAFNGTLTSVFIPANTLTPNRTYLAELGFYKIKNMDNTTYPGAYGVTVFGSFTDFTVNTTNSQTKLNFYFQHFAYGGDFRGGFTPATDFPIAIKGYVATLVVTNDTFYPPADNIFFTGPAGSGLNDSPAASSAPNTGFTAYFSGNIFNPAIAPAGNWTVTYKGAAEHFSVPDPEAAARLFIPVPTVTVSGDTLVGLSWANRDTNGVPLASVPLYVTKFQVQIFDKDLILLHSSSNLSFSTTNYTISVPVQWSKVGRVRMTYWDTLGNRHLINYNQATPILSSAARFSNDQFQFLVTGLVDQNYTVQFSSTLTNWENLFLTNAPNSPFNIVDSHATNAAGFYRIVTGQ